MKRCLTCNKLFKKPYNVSLKTWKYRKYCGRKCTKTNFLKENSTFYKNRNKKGVSMFGIKKCLLCNNDFESMSPKQKYCGSKKNKIGCSYKIWDKKRKEREKKYSNKKRKYQHIYCHKCNKEFPEGNNARRFYCDNCRKKIILKKGKKLKLRFLILERDIFTCQYCGRRSPEVELQIDHIYTKSKGGLNKIENYKTACKDCNLGKGDYLLQEFLI